MILFIITCLGFYCTDVKALYCTSVAQGQGPLTACDRVGGFLSIFLHHLRLQIVNIKNSQNFLCSMSRLDCMQLTLFEHFQIPV